MDASAAFDVETRVHGTDATNWIGLRICNAFRLFDCYSGNVASHKLGFGGKVSFSEYLSGIFQYHFDGILWIY